MTDARYIASVCWLVVGDTEKKRQLSTAESKPPRLLPSSGGHYVPTYDTDFVPNDAGLQSTLRGCARHALITSLAAACLIRR